LTEGVCTKWFEFLGDGVNGHFGQGIAVTQNGRQFVAASSDYDNGRGQIVLFKLFDELWIPVSAFEGLSAGAHLAFNSMGGSMTDDGSLLGADSVHKASTNGIIQVFEALATPSLAQAPAASPSLDSNAAHANIVRVGTPLRNAT
jgi:hypothetical protein